MASQGDCLFLEADKLCTLYKRHGEPLLPNVCVTFPRITLRWEKHLAVAGTLGCPEVARLALLAEDALEPECLPAERTRRPEAAFRATSDNPEEGWVFHAGAVRAAALRLLSLPEQPLTVRLYLLGQLGLRLRPFYFEGTEAFRGEGRAGAEALLAEVLAACDSPRALEAARAELAPLPVPGAFFGQLYSGVLRSRLQHPKARCRTLARGVVDSYGGPEVAPETAWALYEERRERLARVHGARVHQYFHHHDVNHWLQAHFLHTPSVLVDAFHLVLSGGLLRWTLLGHPEVVRLCEAGASVPPEAARERLDAAAVECFQVVTRHMLRDPDFAAYAVAFASGGEAQALELMRAVLLAYRDAAPRPV
jgi:lysine-N-methylase